MAMELPHSGAWRNALPIMPDSLKRRVLDAFQRIHAQGVLHGDVALKNIVVGINDKVTIMNFGNASCLEGLDHPNISSCPWSALEREMRAVKYIIDYDGAKEKERSLRDLNVDAANCENSGPSNSEILSLALEDMERWDREATDESIQDLVYLESEWINRPLPNDGRALPKRHGDHMRGKMRASRHRKNLSSPLHLSLDIPSTAQVDGLSEASYNPSSSSSLSKRLDLRPSTASPLLEPEPATSEELADIPATIASNFLSAEPASSTASTSRNADLAGSSTTARAIPSDDLSTLDLHHALRHCRREFDSELEEAFNPKRPRLDCETEEKGVTFHPDVNDNGVWATGFPLIAAWDRSPTPFPGGEWLDLEDSDTSYDGSDCGSCLTPRSFLAGVSPVAPPELPLTPGSSSIVTPLEPAVDPQRVMRPTRRWPSLPPRTVVFIDEHGKREVYQLPIAIFAAAKGFVTHEQSADRLHRFEEHPQQKENNGTQPPAGSSRPEINGYNERRIRRSRKRKISDLDDDVDD
ncbi:hypothetical protein BJ138DRAFT_1147048 [Hygrophoropsis aurantiaca]|uniref:Uncharacterized protein n=1 Tax=Hygrophoropsis aurantiaca TaxID=72124 RepID=A0ACB8AIJ3_9AGAM|nr:hypothetical protein BJ138DRAFT_1147048 [Hygrophoropsis aurantiaca]